LLSAGGNDAVFCVAIAGDDVVQNVEALWSSWSATRVTPLLCTEALDGIRSENVEQFSEYLQKQ
jgi:phosphomevalonate kinase